MKNQEQKLSFYIELGKFIEDIITQYHKRIKELLPLINVHLKTVEKIDHSYPEIISANELYKKLKELTEQHLNKTVQFLYPFIKKMAHENSEAFLNGELINISIEVMKSEHDKILAALLKIKQLTNTFQPDINSAISLKDAYLQLAELEQLLNNLFIVERQILLPKLVRLKHFLLSKNTSIIK